MYACPTLCYMSSTYSLRLWRRHPTALATFIYRFTLFSASFAMANAGEAQAAQAAAVDGEQAVRLAVVKVWADWLHALDTGIHLSHPPTKMGFRLYRARLPEARSCGLKG